MSFQLSDKVGPPGIYNVKTYGAVGDGVTNDYAAIAATISACSVGGVVEFPPGTYLTNTSIVVNKWIRVTGLGVGATIKAGAAIASIANYSVGGCTTENITFDGNANANYSVYLSQGQSSQFQSCSFINALIDGVHCPGSGNQDFADFKNCTFIGNGTTYRTNTAFHPAGTNACRKVAVTGTVATTTGSATITGTGTSFLSYGIRKGDTVVVGLTSTEYLVIVSVDSDTQLTVEALPGATQTRSAQEFAICVGDGYHEEHWMDNNIISHDNCLYRSNANNGLRLAGLYGARLSKPFVETNGSCGISIGTQGGTNYVLGCSITDLYDEANYGPAAVHCGHVFGLSIINALSEKPIVRVSNANYVSGTIGGDVLHDAGYYKIKSIGLAKNEIPITELAAGVNFGGYQVNPFSYVVASSSGNVVSATVTVPSYAAVVFLDISEGTKLAGTPSISDGTIDGQEITFKGSYSGRPVILQDESVLTGSKLRLKTPYTYLDPQGYIRLRWTNGAWYEQWRSPLVTNGSVVGSPGTNNVVSGNAASSSFTTGTDNVSIGHSAMGALTTGSHNVAIGDLALSLNATTDYVTAVGASALKNSTGPNNTAVGARALITNTTGDSNTAIGLDALYSNSTGASNVAVGRNAAFSITSNNNIAIGQSAMYYCTSTSDSVAIGHNAMSIGVGTGTNNVAVGGSSLLSNTSGSYNVALGNSSLDLNTTGGSNIAIGYQTLHSNIAGVNNTAIGVLAAYTNTGSGNVAVGREALKANTSASNITAVGAWSLFANTTGGQNVGVGAYSMYANTTGIENTAVGGAAMLTNITGNYNTALGSNALRLNAAGQYNTAIGRESLYNATGSYNTGVGAQSLITNTSGDSNTAVGTYSLNNNTTGSHNSALGLGALYGNTTGGYNAAMGENALNSNTTGAENTAIGFNSLRLNVVGTYNVAVGNYAMYANTGSQNTTIGYNSLAAVTSGVNNVALGYSVGSTTLTTGSSNVLIGTSAAVTTPAASTSNFLNIGNTLFGTSVGTGSVASPAGAVGVLTTAPSSSLEVNGSFAAKLTSTATGITLDSTHHTVVVTATGQTITLPTAASITGRIYTVKLSASGSGTVATTSSQTIDGATTYSLSAQYKYVTVQSDGSNWHIIANN